MQPFPNPFRPGAGHPPPYLAGRQEEKQEFARLLGQETILENMVLTGLRGVGKTVLLDSFKPKAIEQGWLWVGTDLSESTSVSENSMATRLCADLALVTSKIVVAQEVVTTLGFGGTQTTRTQTLTFEFLSRIYETTPGLASDKLKAVLETAWRALSASGGHRGLIFAYDEAQTLSDQAKKEQYPLSLLLDVFQSVQKKGFPLLLLLTGLPTLFPKLVEARTFAERMFRVVFLKSLSNDESREAVQKPIADARCPVKLAEPGVSTIVEMSGGYPYFIQFVCREVYDVVVQTLPAHESQQDFQIPMRDIERKLDTDFFAGRWARATDRQRELLNLIATLPNCDEEFTVQEIVDASRTRATTTTTTKTPSAKTFSNSHANQMLSTLGKQGLVFKNRHGKYSFAVPLLGRFIGRQSSETRPSSEVG